MGTIYRATFWIFCAVIMTGPRFSFITIKLLSAYTFWWMLAPLSNPVLVFDALFMSVFSIIIELLCASFTFKMLSWIYFIDPMLFKLLPFNAMPLWDGDWNSPMPIGRKIIFYCLSCSRFFWELSSLRNYSICWIALGSDLLKVLACIFRLEMGETEPFLLYIVELSCWATSMEPVLFMVVEVPTENCYLIGLPPWMYRV